MQILNEQATMVNNDQGSNEPSAPYTAAIVLTTYIVPANKPVCLLGSIAFPKATVHNLI